MYVSFLTLVTSFAAEEAEHAGGIAALGLDIKSFLLQLATFLLVFFILKKYAFGPILKALEERRKTIEKGLKTAKELEERDAKSAEEYERVLAKARNEAAKELDQAKKEAGEIVKAAEEKAVKRSEQIVAEGRVRIAEDVKAAKRELKSETVDLVIGATQTIIGERLDEHKDHGLIEKALEKAGGAK